MANDQVATKPEATIAHDLAFHANEVFKLIQRSWSDATSTTPSLTKLNMESGQCGATARLLEEELVGRIGKENAGFVCCDVSITFKAAESHTTKAAAKEFWKSVDMPEEDKAFFDNERLPDEIGHCINVFPDGRVIDLTLGQFTENPLIESIESISCRFAAIGVDIKTENPAYDSIADRLFFMEGNIDPESATFEELKSNFKNAARDLQSNTMPKNVENRTFEDFKEYVCTILDVRHFEDVDSKFSSCYDSKMTITFSRKK